MAFTGACLAWWMASAGGGLEVLKLAGNAPEDVEGNNELKFRLRQESAAT